METLAIMIILVPILIPVLNHFQIDLTHFGICLLYTSDAADERSSVDLGGRRIIKKKKTVARSGRK